MRKVLTPEEACREAVIAGGGPTAVGRYFGISAAAVSKWKRVPPEYVRELAALGGYRVSIFAMQPAVYGSSFRELRLACG